MASARRVLITGINGFTGHHVAERFAVAGYEITGLGSQAHYGGALPRIAYRQADLEDPAGLAAAVAALAPSTVIHLAARAFVGHDDAEAFYRVNLIGTRNLLVALRASDLPLERVLLASSANIYGADKEGSLGEDTPPAPANDYAVSKLAMEHMARVFLPALPITIARPFNYTGRGQSEQFLVAKIVAHFRRRAPAIELGNIDVSRDFSDVRTLAEAYLALCQRAPAGTVVNVCSGVPRSLREIIEIASVYTGHDLTISINPAFVRTNEIRSLTGDPRRLRAIAPDLPSYDFADTLAWMLDEPS